MSGKDKKAQRAALRNFLVETPGALERASASLGWLVLLGAIALVALVLHLLFARPDHPPATPPVAAGDNPSGALYVRDLGRLPDGRHTFDLVYVLVLRSVVDRPVAITFVLERLSVGDPPPAADVTDLGPAPGAFGAATGAWHQLASHREDAPSQPNRDLVPGQWRALRAHFRIVARPDQFADVAIAYGLNHGRRGWFDPRREPDQDAHDEDVQFGAVLRAHCPLGVKVQNGEVRSLCGS